MNDSEQIQLLFPEENFDVLQNHMECFHEMIKFYKCAMMVIETKLKVLNEEFSPELDRHLINNTKSRLKSYRSIKEKAERIGCAMTPYAIEKNLNDIAGIRVICSFKDDVYKIADALIRQSDITLISKKDYIENPKPNGYRSLHLIIMLPIFFEQEKQFVKVEIQLRTVAMDFWASLEHQLRYKKTITNQQAISEQLKSCADIITEADEKMLAIRKQIESASNFNAPVETILPDLK